MIVGIGLTVPPAFSSKLTINQLLLVSGPSGVAVEVLPHPAVTGADRAVVHAVAHVRATDRHCWQPAVVAREGAERPVDACRQVGEVAPRVVLAPISTRRASLE